MLKVVFFFIFSFVFAVIHAQDSLSHKPVSKFDSIVNHKTLSVDSLHNKSLDSLQKNFNHRTDSLQKAFEAPMNKLQAQLNHLHHKKDSLAKLNLSTQSVTDEIESVQQKQTAKWNELNSSIDQVKKETLSKASALQLPPQAQNEINALTKNIQGFSAPDLSKMSGLQSNLSGNIGSQLSIPSSNIPSLRNLNTNASELSSLSQAEALNKEISQVQSKATLESAEKTVTNDLSQNAGVKSMLNEQAQVKDMAGQIATMNDPKNAEALAKQQLQPAINHFAGKEQELKSAMDQVSKLKQKYSSVKSMAELPKRRPNPLKGKPWIERVIPGMNYFIMNKHITLVDFNPYIGWRFTPNLRASIGWNERVGISHYNFNTPKYERVYGLRASASYTWAHGINFMISPEVMKAYVPSLGTPDAKHQALVWGLYAGVRNDFPIYKSIKGHSEVLYNFAQQPFQNIYGDRVSFRLGIEVQLKKKVKKEKTHGVDSLLNQYKSSVLKRPTMLGRWMEEIRLKKIESKKYTSLLKQRFTKPEIRYIKKKKAFTGMSEEALYQALGNPIETYVTNLNGATKKQCVYQHNLTVFITNGKVSSIQKASR
jgi:hypothetical protein